MHSHCAVLNEMLESSSREAFVNLQNINGNIWSRFLNPNPSSTLRCRPSCRRHRCSSTPSTSRNVPTPADSPVLRTSTYMSAVAAQSGIRKFDGRDISEYYQGPIPAGQSLIAIDQHAVVISNFWNNKSDINVHMINHILQIFHSFKRSI